MKRTIAVAALSAVMLAGCATTYDVTPVAAEGQQVRYDHGMATASAEDGTVRTSPLGFNEEKQIMFGVAVYNKTGAPIDMTYDKVMLWTADGRQIPLYDKKTLERQVRNRAMIAAIAVAAAGAGAAYSANANAYSTTHATLFTPRGGAYHFTSTTYDPATAYAASAAATAATGASLALIHNRLGETLSGINGRILQTSTVDPDQTYGGVVVGDRLKAPYPQDLILKVNWGGAEQSFRYHVASSK